MACKSEISKVIAPSALRHMFDNGVIKRECLMTQVFDNLCLTSVYCDYIITALAL